MDEHFLYQEEDLWKCRKHPSFRRITGVCPTCLRDRLLLLCPDCGNVRPCSLCPSSSSSSSFSSISSVDPARSSVSGAIGTVGRVSSLIENEPPFRRSRSVVFSFKRREIDGGNAAKQSARWGNFWPFSKKEEAAEAPVPNFTNYSRSMSVGPANYSGSGDEARGKSWKWHFPSPMRAFRHRKSVRIVHERSPLCRG